MFIKIIWNKLVYSSLSKSSSSDRHTTIKEKKGEVERGAYSRRVLIWHFMASKGVGAYYKVVGAYLRKYGTLATKFAQPQVDF